MVIMDPLIRTPRSWAGDGGHVIIAEDNAITRRMIEMVIIRIGWTFDSAGDGVTALSAAERRAQDLALVLSDIEMPVMNGIELLETMKVIPSLAHVPVVLMSSPDWEPEARAVGCAAFLAKPFKLKDLLDALNL